jgi:hypothetical protein
VENNVSQVRGIKGLSSGVFLGKLYIKKDWDYGQLSASNLQFSLKKVFVIMFLARPSLICLNWL